MKLNKRSDFKNSKLLRHSVTDYDSLESFMKNVYYVEGSDFKEEAVTIGEILDILISKEKFQDIREFFIMDILNVGNKNKLKNLISVLYILKNKYFNKLDVVLLLQDLLSKLLISELSKNIEFSDKLNLGGLNIKSFLDIRYKEEFEKTGNKDWIEQYRALMDNTLNSLSEICKFIILDTKINQNFKKRYLESYLEELNRSLEHLETLIKYDFLGNEEIKEIKSNLIMEKKKLLQEIKLNMLFLILYKIDQEKLQKDFFEVAYKLYSSGNLVSELNNPLNPLKFHELEWLMYDQFKGGAQTIPWFNYNRYRLLILFYNYLQNNKKETGIKNLSKEDFMGSIFDLEKELNNIEESFFDKYFSFNKKDLTEFKKISLKEVKKRKKEVANLEEDYIKNSDLEEKYVEQFKQDCYEIWKKKQEELSNIFEIKKINKDNKDILFFVQNKLFPKEWFLEPFNPQVGMSRDRGKDFGRDQAESKYRKVLEDLNSEFNKSLGDKEIKINDLYNDLVKNIGDGKEYYLFYTGREIYDIPNMEWERGRISVAKLKIKNSIIHFCYSRIKEVLLLEKDCFVLKQHLIKGEELSVEVSKDFTKKEKKQILETSKNIGSEEEIKKYVKIKVLEKFEIERKRGCKIKRLII
ncbi:hypothetical protein K9L16_02630 [Candidatus Pacearchaeota archaeon]|nr:hypothetical protein [Candidatus Pacearchaeota archaeon]